MDKNIYRIMWHIFGMAMIIFLAFFVCFLLTFHTFYIVEDSKAVTIGGAGSSNDEQFSGELKGIKLSSTDATISNGVVAYSTYYMNVLGEGGVDDNLDTITGGNDGAIVTIFPASLDSDITLKDGTGNLDLNNADIVLKHLGDIAILRKSGSVWKLVFSK